MSNGNTATATATDYAAVQKAIAAAAGKGYSVKRGKLIKTRKQVRDIMSSKSMKGVRRDQALEDAIVAALKDKGLMVEESDVAATSTVVADPTPQVVDSEASEASEESVEESSDEDSGKPWGRIVGIGIVVVGGLAAIGHWGLGLF